MDEVRVATDTGESVRQHAVLGEAIPGMQVRASPADERAGGIVGREVGEIEIRGSSMMSGYLGHEPIDAEGWFSTGDLGYLVDGAWWCAGAPRK